MSFDDLAGHHGALAYALGLALTLVLAAFLTPARWWRRPTARGLAILGGGAWAFGALLLHFAVAAPPRAHAGAGAGAGVGTDTAGMQADVPAQHAGANVPVAGQRYRVHRDLNVRAAPGVGAARQAVVPAGAFVTPTGERAGDWWRIRYDGGGMDEDSHADSYLVGWASSLWLRRAAER